MGLLDSKVALIFGVANDRSIAWGITQAFAREGAQIGISYAGEASKSGCVRWQLKSGATLSNLVMWLRMNKSSALPKKLWTLWQGRYPRPCHCLR